VTRIGAACLAILLCAGATLADDGDKAWTFEVLEIAESDPEGHIIRLRPSPPGKRFPRDCSTFVIYSIFDVSDWSDTGQQHVTPSRHARALHHIVQARASDRLIRIGVLGRGFAAMHEKGRCEVASRALQHVVRDGNPAILSFFDEP